jgi:hypothetical protein
MAQQIAPKKHRAKPAQASLLAIYDSQECLGTIRVGVRGDAVAYDAKGKRIGTFASVQAATEACEKRSGAQQFRGCRRGIRPMSNETRRTVVRTRVGATVRAVGVGYTTIEAIPNFFVGPSSPLCQGAVPERSPRLPMLVHILSRFARGVGMLVGYRRRPPRSIEVPR